MSALQEVEQTVLRHPDPVVSVPEIAEQIGRSTTHIRQKLELLEYEERVRRKDVGARATAWWHVERVRPARTLGDDEPQGQSALAREAAEDAHSAESGDAPEGLDAVEFPDSRDREDCVQAVQAAREFIRDREGATMRQIVTSVGPDHPIGYDVPGELAEGERYRGAWWRHVVKPGLKAIEDVESPPVGGSKWRWRGGSDE